ncbi:MAG: carbohydrate ABC transporter permease [Meiothermus sp.]|nr:carbohydrate ABC transporter permease [Meiothermus sp.]
MIGYRWQNRLARFGMSLLLLAFIAFLAFPVVWLTSTAFKPANEVGLQNPALLPAQPTLDNFRVAVVEQGVMQSAANTFKIAVLSALLTLLVALPAAYLLARRRSRMNQAVTVWILVTQTFPLILIIVPLFLILSQLGLVNTHTGLILVYVVWSLPFVLWMLQGYVRGIPVQLEEAAAVDGASQIDILGRIILPLLVPGLIATGLYAFVNAWNEFFFALVMLKSPDLVTLQVNLSRLRGVEGLARWGPLAAGSLIAIIPTLIVFAFMQRRLVSGFLAGSVKE